MKKCLRQSRASGQALLELVISVAIFIIVVGAIIGVFLLSTKSKANATLNIALKTLSQQTQQDVINVARQNWMTVYGAAKGAGNPYYVLHQAPSLSLATGTEAITVNGMAFTRSLYFELAYRDVSGNLASSGTEDKSAQKVTVIVTSARGSYQASFYLTRWANKATLQSNWSGGPNASSPVTSFSNTFTSSTSIVYGTTSLNLSPQ